MRRKMNEATTALLAVLLIVSFLVLATQIAAAKDYSKFGIAKDLPGTCSYAATDAKDYRGKTLNIITNAIPVMGEPTRLHAKQFAELTGAKVNVVYVPFGDLYQKIMIPLETGEDAYDVMFYGSLWIGDLHSYLAPVPKFYQQSTGMKDVTATYKSVASWGNQMLQYTVDGDRNYLKYRSTIFANPKIRAKYKAATGKVLRVPQTWTAYNRISKFFSGWDWDGDGKLNYGSAEITKRDDLLFSAFIDRAAPFAKDPNVKGGFFFDLKTMKPLINTPGWVRGLKSFIAGEKGFPPGGMNFGLSDAIYSFGGGQTAMEYTWDDPFIQAMQKGSRIRNKVGVALDPGSHYAWNRDTGKWDYFAKPNRAPYITWGWTAGVSKLSKVKKMAFDFLCFFSNRANTLHDLQVGRYGINPHRKSGFNWHLWHDKMGWSKKISKEYVNTLLSMDRSKNRVFDLRVPGVNRFMSSLATGVSEALAGQKTAQEALNDVAKQWTKIVNQIGKNRVRSAYAKVVALEDNVK